VSLATLFQEYLDAYDEYSTWDRRLNEDSMFRNKALARAMVNKAEREMERTYTELQRMGFDFTVSDIIDDTITFRGPDFRTYTYRHGDITPDMDEPDRLNGKLAWLTAMAWPFVWLYVRVRRVFRC